MSSDPNGTSRSPVSFNNRGSFFRYLRLLIFALVCAVVLLDLGLAGFYVYSLTHPRCAANPTPLGGQFPVDEIWLERENGSRIRAWYYPSRNGAAIIVMGAAHGALGSNLPPAGALLEAGYGLIQIDSRACGDPPSAVTLGYLEAEDALLGLKFLQERSEIDPERIGIFGFSMGGVASIRAAARSEEISAVIAEGGYHNLGENIMEPGGNHSIFMQAFRFTIAIVFRLLTGVNPWDSDPIGDIGTISPRPIFLIYGKLELADSKAVDQYNAAGEPKTFWQVPEGNHGTNHLVNPEIYSQKIVSFYDISLPPTVGP